MNWETHKGMTSEQKEEYNYKFANKSVMPNITKITAPTITIMLLGLLLLTQSYLIQTDDRFIQFRPQIDSIIESVITLLNVILSIILVVAVFEAIMGGIHYYRRHKWFKDNNIKVIKKRFFKS